MNRRKIVVSFLCAMLPGTGCSKPVRTGLDNIDQYQRLFADKRVGIVMNHTAVNRKGQTIVEVFRHLPAVRVTALFGPEHGFAGLAEDGADVEDAAMDGIPVYSLYGTTNKPTAEMLRDVDVLVFDIQDIGARFYTYVYTMALAMEAAGEHGKEFVVLDRPNPINGVTVEGNLLEPKFASFVGLYPIPLRHGMTAGELARLFTGQGWLAGGVKPKLEVVPMTGWKRKMWYDQTGLVFVKPSPNMPSLETAAIYPGLCLIEGTNLSEGRGTDKPFLQFGAPWVDATALCKALNTLRLPGIEFQPTSFVPDSSKHKGQLCHGARILITDRDKIEAYWTGIQVVAVLHKMYPEKMEFRAGHFDRLCGTDKVRQTILSGGLLVVLRDSWQIEVNRFEKMRKEYLLY
ncbi:MAG: DUF1343 domain-containing protein [Sedimentisphaerales bacterium]|nr:DUF1343 domain-containing protein [Sedimentisphaerales bacterium]